MDPKKLQGIDPKLQDAYNRIMATPTPKSTPAPSQPPAPQTPQPTPQVQTAQPVAQNNSQQPMTPPPLPTLTPIGPSKSDIAATGKQTGVPAASPVGMIAFPKEKLLQTLNCCDQFV